MISKYIGPVSWSKSGDVTTEHIHIARNMLGRLEYSYKINNWQSFSVAQQLGDGTTIRVSIINGQYIADISVPEGEDEKKQVSKKGNIIIYYDYPDGIDGTFYQEAYLDNQWKLGSGGSAELGATNPSDIIGTLTADYPEAGQYFFGGSSALGPITCCGLRANLYTAYNLFPEFFPDTETPPPSGFTHTIVHNNRYNINPAGLMPDIYVAGRHLCNAPAPLAGGTVFNNKLVCIKYNSIPLSLEEAPINTLTVYSRPLRSSYGNDEPYHETNNPDGWKTTEVPISTPLWMKQTIQFNTEGDKGIVNCGVSDGDDGVLEESIAYPQYVGYEVIIELQEDIYDDINVTFETRTYLASTGEIPEVPTYGTVGTITYPQTIIETPYLSTYTYNNSPVKLYASSADYHLSGTYSNTFEYSGYVDGIMTIKYEFNELNSIANRTQTSHIETSNWIRSADPEYSAVIYDTYFFNGNPTVAQVTPKSNIFDYTAPSYEVISGINFGITSFPIPVDDEFNFTPRLRNPTFFMSTPTNISDSKIWGLPKRYADFILGQIVAQNMYYQECLNPAADLNAFLNDLSDSSGRVLYVSSY